MWAWFFSIDFRELWIRPNLLLGSWTVQLLVPLKEKFNSHLRRNVMGNPSCFQRSHRMVSEGHIYPLQTTYTNLCTTLVPLKLSGPNSVKYWSVEINSTPPREICVDFLKSPAAVGSVSQVLHPGTTWTCPCRWNPWGWGSEKVGLLFASSEVGGSFDCGVLHEPEGKYCPWSRQGTI